MDNIGECFKMNNFINRGINKNCSDCKPYKKDCPSSPNRDSPFVTLRIIVHLRSFGEGLVLAICCNRR